MNKLNQIEKLLESIRDDARYSDEEKQMRYNLVDDCLDSYVRYHNEAVNQGRQLTIQRFRVGFDEFADKVDEMHERRKAMHTAMIDHTAVVNNLCAAQGQPPFYDGPLDVTKGRMDNDTRFGVARHCEETCHAMYESTHEIGVPAKAVEAYKDYAQRLVSEGSNWSTLQHMLHSADARSRMTAKESPDR